MGDLTGFGMDLPLLSLKEVAAIVKKRLICKKKKRDDEENEMLKIQEEEEGGEEEVDEVKPRDGTKTIPPLKAMR